VVLHLTAAPASAQGSVADTLSFLLTTQSVPTGDFVKDEQSAEVTRDTITRLLLSEITTVPLSSSSGGFAYRFNESLGTVERASESFGPFFTERSLMIGRGRASVGGQVQVARFSELDIYNLRDGTFVTTANRFQGQREPFDTESLTLKLDTTTFTLFGHVGLHERIDLGVAVPFIRLALDGSRLNVYRGTPLLQADATASATGFGDLAVRAKVNLLDAGGSGLAVLEDVRLPTGREEDLLGAGTASFRTVFIASSEAGRFAAHGNLGATVGGLSDGFDYRAAVTVGVLPQLTLIGELLGRRISDVGRLVEEQVPHPLLAGVETLRLVTTDEGVNTAALVLGTKWNLRNTWLLNLNLSIPLTQAGLRSDVLMLFGLDYAFEW
jgi:hypothetical protein